MITAERLEETPAIQATARRVQVIGEYFKSKFPYFSKVIEKRREEFGNSWLQRFESDLAHFFGDDEERLIRAAHGYGLFALDGMKLQKKFDKTLQYEHRRYEDLKNEVYLNRDYMFGLYLPGILLSHFLWPHHYRQLLWFEENFIPLVKKSGVKTFCDVGVGTGFYSKEMLRSLPEVRGEGHDISNLSLEHTQIMVKAWKFESRYQIHQHDILKEPSQGVADAAVNVEVLEHLEDPVQFLKGLRRMIKPGGLAFITAAIDAPNKDHIYLYRDLDSIERELRVAGFDVVMRENFPAFIAASLEETVPQNGSFIVRAS